MASNHSAAPASQGSASASDPGSSRFLLGAGAVLGPILLAAGTALDWTGSGADPIAYVSRLADARAVYLAAGLLLMFGMAFLVVTATGILRASSHRPGAVLLRISGVLIGLWGLFGTAGVAGGYTAGLVSADLVGAAPDGIVEQVFKGITFSPFTTIAGVTGGAAFFLGTLTLGIGILLARGLPRWAGGAVIAAVPLALLQGTGIHWLGAASFVLLALGVAGLVPAMLDDRGPRMLARWRRTERI